MKEISHPRKRTYLCLYVAMNHHPSTHKHAFNFNVFHCQTTIVVKLTAYAYRYALAVGINIGLSVTMDDINVHKYNTNRYLYNAFVCMPATEFGNNGPQRNK